MKRCVGDQQVSVLAENFQPGFRLTVVMILMLLLQTPVLATGELGNAPAASRVPGTNSTASEVNSTKLTAAGVIGTNLTAPGQPAEKLIPCPATGDVSAGKPLPRADACSCNDPYKTWTGFACCLLNAHWNGTECECNSGAVLENGRCCAVDDHKGWGDDRCGCLNGSVWNGNSCIPGGVLCPPNALWNGTCYCKPANWSAGVHPEFMANGACCPQNAFYDWEGDKGGKGQCHCNEGFVSNGTSCVPPGSLGPPPVHVKLKAGIGGGVGAALLLAGCVGMGILFLKARKADGAKSQRLHPFKRLAKAAGLMSRGDAAGADPPPGQTNGEIDEPPSLASRSAAPSSGPTTLAVSSGTTATSTALDLLKENPTLYGPFGDPEYFPMLEIGTSSVETGTQTPGQASGSGTSSRHQGSASRSRGRSGKLESARTDSARTFYSLLSGLRSKRKSGGTPNGSTTPFATGGNRPSEIVPEPVTRGGDQPDHEELWTTGVNPADVEIMRDTRGRPVVLGRGAYAVVFLGRWQATQVAVKVMLTNDSDAALREARSEADILRGLRHPNIVLLMAVCVSPAQQMMVILEYCSGGNLHKALHEDRKNTQRQLGWYSANGKQAGKGFVVAVDIARGLAYLHHRQLIHFDIKPANILLDSAWSHAKISDVGLSKSFQGSFMSQTMRGTPAFMAPELMSAKHAPSFAVDVYSFGVVLHAIITGNEADRRKGGRALRVGEECSAVVAKLYLSCISEDPKARPTASDIVSILEQEFCIGRTQSEPPPTLEQLAVTTPRIVRSVGGGVAGSTLEASSSRNSTLESVEDMV